MKRLGWPLVGSLLGALLGLVMFAPATWLAQAMASASNGHLLITDARGSVWRGSGVLVLTGGVGSRDASALPGRVRWVLGVQGLGLLIKAQQDCCINGELQALLKPGLGRSELRLTGAKDWLARWPATWLAGLGTPWNTLQLGGSLRMSARDFAIESVQGRWRQIEKSGQMDLELSQLSSRLSTVEPLGSYRFSISADPTSAGVSLLKLSTLDGALLLNGQGSWSAGKARFLGDAAAAPGFEAALNNLLNIIGRRQGERSVISIG
jgi:general secretion pathway protein N